MRSILAFLCLVLMMPPGLQAACTRTGAALSATTTVTGIYCNANDGSIQVTAINGWRDAAAPNGNGYSYAITAGPITRPSQSSPVFLSLPAGNYTISITDCNGTTITVSATVGGTTPAALAYNPVLYNSVCANNNAVKLNPSGGRVPYTITVLSAPAGSAPVIKGDTITGLAAGIVQVSVKDACGAVLGATFTQTSAWPLSSHLPTCISYYACHGYMHYTPVITGVTNAALWIDSIYTELYFNGALRQSIVLGTVMPYTYISRNIFNIYGDGTYVLKTYAKCAGLINYDSFIVGNRPAAPPGTNNSITDHLRWATRDFTCSGFDLNLVFVAAKPSYNEVLPAGAYYNTMGSAYKATIISGPSRIGYSVLASPVFTNGNAATLLSGLPYSATPYGIEIADSCGHKDTFYITQNTPVFTKKPAGTIVCNDYVRSRKQGILREAYIPGAVPKREYLKTTFLSGPPIWMSYPFSIIDSGAANWSSLPILPGMPSSTAYTLKVAYENGCGQKDTTTWTYSAACTAPAGRSDITVTPRCGNRGDIALGRIGTPRYRIIASPAGSSVGQGYAGSTYLNQPAGNYTILEYMGNSMNDNVNNRPGYLYATGEYKAPVSAAGTTTAVYPFGINQVTRTEYPAAVDTAYLRLWDTTYTLNIPNSTFSISAINAHPCNTGDTSYIMINSRSNVSGNTYYYSYATVSSSGPWSTAVTDSLLRVSPAPVNSRIWLQATDNCGSAATASAAVSQLQAITYGSCSSNVVTMIPNPNNSNFRYQLRKTADNTTTTYNYGAAITIDAGNPANAGSYVLYYILSGGSSSSCILDSTAFTVSSPCGVSLPLELLDFTGHLSGQSVTLYWYTASEQAYRGFIVERSADGVSWQPVTTIPCKYAAYNAYSYSDDDPGAGIIYYRLRIAGDGGTFRYSATLRFVRQAKPGSTLQIYPNPATDRCRISGLTAAAQLSIHNLNGQLLRQQVLPEKENNLDLEGLPPGIYTLTVQEQHGVTKLLLIRE